MQRYQFLSPALLTALFGVTTANPVPNPIAPSLAATSESLVGCVTTIVVTEDSPKPPKTWQPTWTVTVHTSTSTQNIPTDCGGCSYIHTDTLFIDYAYPSGPSAPTMAVETAKGPAVTTKYSCHPSSPGNVGRGAFGAPKPQLPMARGSASECKADWNTGRSIVRRDIPDPQSHPHKLPQLCTKRVLELPQFTHGPTFTRWTSTSTRTRTLDCGHCRHVEPTYLPIGVPPVVNFNVTVTATEPSIATVFACASTGSTNGGSHKRSEHESSVHYYQAPPYTVHTVTPEGVPNPQCTSHAAVSPDVPNETETIYQITETYTSTADCDKCILEWSTPVLEFFAPIRITSTVTASAPTTSTVVTCAKATGGPA